MKLTQKSSDRLVVPFSPDVFPIAFIELFCLKVLIHLGPERKKKLWIGGGLRKVVLTMLGRLSECKRIPSRKLCFIQCTTRTPLYLGITCFGQCGITRKKNIVDQKPNGSTNRSFSRTKPFSFAEHVGF